MTTQRPLPVIHRQTLHMVANNAEEIAAAIGLPPISDELAEMEQKDAQRRLAKVVKLAPAITDQASLLARVYVRVQRDQAAANGMPVDEIDWGPVYETIFHWLNCSGMSLLALLVDLDVLHLDAEWEVPSEQTQEQP